MKNLCKVSQYFSKNNAFPEIYHFDQDDNAFDAQKADAPYVKIVQVVAHKSKNVFYATVGFRFRLIALFLPRLGEDENHSPLKKGYVEEYGKLARSNPETQYTGLLRLTAQKERGSISCSIPTTCPFSNAFWRAVAKTAP